MFFKTDMDNVFYNIFRLRYTLDADVDDKIIEKFDNEIQRDLTKKIDEETNKIRFRTLQQVEEFLENVEECLDKKIEKLKRKDRLLYYKWLEEKKNAINQLTKEANDDKDFLIKKMTNIDNKDEEIDFRLNYLLSQIVEQVEDTFSTIATTLSYEKFSRRKTQVSKVVKCFTAFFMVLLRVIEINKHWEKIDEETKKILEELVYWDLDTMNRLTQSLPPKKKEQIEKELLPDEELINALWG